MSKYVIHVNRHFIAANTKDGGTRPIYTVKEGSKKVRYAREVVIHGPSHLVYNGDQLSCGARAWITTDAELQLIDEMDYQEAKEMAG